MIATQGEELPQGVVLPEKDRPIFCGALAARARYLVTGDKVHFGRHFGQDFPTDAGPPTVISPRALLDILESSR